jgi:hypothetical protein
MGYAQRLPNGNTLITESSFGRFFEVTKEGEIVWEYVNPFFGKPFFSRYRCGVESKRDLRRRFVQLVPAGGANNAKSSATILAFLCGSGSLPS